MSDEQWIPGNKAELMSVIEREWKLLMDVVAKLDVTKMVTPDAGGWSPKDNLAHLGEWMNIMMGYHMDGRPSHEVVKMDPKITKDWDFEVINQILFERHRNRPVDEVLNELPVAALEIGGRRVVVPRVPPKLTAKQKKLLEDLAAEGL